MKTSIPLNDAPSIFFDQHDWAEFVSYFPTAEIALARISVPPQYRGYYFEEDEFCPARDEAGDEKCEALYRLGNSLIGDLQAKLIAGELISSGFQIGINCEVEDLIPAEHWNGMWPDFNGGYAFSTSFGYRQVKLWRSESKPALRAELIARTTTWLKAQRASGKSLRAALEYDARTYFGPDFRTRVFNLAYKEVFKKKRGRPTKLAPSERHTENDT